MFVYYILYPFSRCSLYIQHYIIIHIRLGVVQAFKSNFPSPHLYNEHVKLWLNDKLNLAHSSPQAPHVSFQILDKLLCFKPFKNRTRKDFHSYYKHLSSSYIPHQLWDGGKLFSKDVIGLIYHLSWISSKNRDSWSTHRNIFEIFN